MSQWRLAGAVLAVLLAGAAGLCAPDQHPATRATSIPAEGVAISDGAIVFTFVFSRDGIYTVHGSKPLKLDFFNLSPLPDGPEFGFSRVLPSQDVEKCQDERQAIESLYRYFKRTAQNTRETKIEPDGIRARFRLNGFPYELECGLGMDRPPGLQGKGEPRAGSVGVHYGRSSTATQSTRPEASRTQPTGRVPSEHLAEGIEARNGEIVFQIVVTPQHTWIFHRGRGLEVTYFPLEARSTLLTVLARAEDGKDDLPLLKSLYDRLKTQAKVTEESVYKWGMTCNLSFAGIPGDWRCSVDLSPKKDVLNREGKPCLALRYFPPPPTE